MGSDSQDLYLQKIEEFVQDEDKIVTFKWLSTTLDVSINKSKTLLEKYVADHRETKPNELGITYIITGLLEDTGIKISVVKEGDLDDISKSFRKLLNKQIYSVQKNTDVDLNVISMVDCFDIQSCRESPVLGSIISKNCIKRVFKQKKPTLPPPPPTIKSKPSLFPNSNDKTASSSKEQVKSIKHSPTSKKGTNSTKFKQNSGGIASFFNKGVKTEVKSKEVEKPIVTLEIKEQNYVDTKSKPSTTKDRIDNLVDSDSDVESPSVKSETINKDIPKKKISKKRPRNDNKDNNSGSKRRKRIVEHNYSDSDDIFASDDQDESRRPEIVEMSDEEPLLKPIPQSPPKLNKRRKLVDRTYTDDDGYIITTKEWIEESPSEGETEQENKRQNENSQPAPQVLKKPEIKQPENNFTNNKSVNGKGRGNKGKKVVTANQPTLMNFFKRN